MLGNIALLIVLRRLNFRSPTYRYVFWLALADLSHMTFDVLYLISTVKKIHMTFSFEVSRMLCRALHPTIHTSGAWSSFMVVVLTAHRLRAVWDPFAFRFQKVKTHVVALAALGLSVLIHVVGCWQYEVLRVRTKDGVERYACAWSAFHKKPGVQHGYVVAREVVTRTLPVTAVFLLNIAITVVYRRRRAQARVLQSGAQSSTGQSDVEEQRVINMLLFIGMAYVICMTPMSLLVVAMSVQDNFGSPDLELFWVSANMLANVQSACNFYLYFFCSRAMRQEFLSVFGGTLRRPEFLSSQEGQNSTRSKAVSPQCA